MNKLNGKIIITGDLKLITGLHISTGGSFSAIGAVDTVVIRDTITNLPMIPGSSLKGKSRFLMERVFSKDSNKLKSIEDDDIKIKRLFGASKPEIILSRLQFKDILLKSDSAKKLMEADLDLPYTEIKYENTINRVTGIANPRQLERVPAGSVFDFKLIYNIEELDELLEDVKNIKKIFELLEDDYIGGHGTRGYGRIKFEGLKVEFKNYLDNIENLSSYEEQVKTIIEG